MFWPRRRSAASRIWRPEAIRAYVETNEWQIGEIQASLREADAGDFAGNKEVAALAKKWRASAR